MHSPTPETRIAIDFLDQRGERIRLRVTPIRVWCGPAEGYPEDRWQLEARDHGSGATRTVALADILSWESPAVRNEGAGNEAAEKIPVPGIYRHYKGHLYQVLEVARHSEDESLVVVYRQLYGEFGLWVRPLEMFTGTVVADGRSRPRFELVSPL